MSILEQVQTQAEAITGVQEGKQKALLAALCNACVAALTARLKEGVCPEDCAEAFVMAAAFHAAASFETAVQETGIQEFKAGDLSITHGCADGGHGFDALAAQGEMLLRPYLKDGFCFAGV